MAFLISESSSQPQDLKKAFSLAEDALRQRPSDPAVLDTLAWVHYRMQDYGQAQSILEEVLDSNPNNPIFNYHMGMVLYKTGQVEAARERLEKAMEGDEHYIGRDVAEATLKELS